jgi:succinate dehydrogenase (ubiquinone) cytochrome b560 subunit
VTIYQFPIGALTSITNRITGVALSVGCLGVASLELVSSGMTQQVFSDLAMSGGGGPFLGGMAKFAVGFPLVYHYLGGVRHLIWDTFPDKYLNNVSVEKTSYVLVGGSLVLSVGLAVLV